MADWILVSLLLSVLLLGGYLFMQRTANALPTVAVRYTLTVNALDRSLLGEDTDPTSLIPLRSTVTNENGTAILGRVVSVERLPYEIADSTDEGIVFVQDPERVRLLITVRTEGTVSPQDGVRVNDIRISAGGTGAFRFGNFYAEQCTVRSVWKEEKQ